MAKRTIVSEAITISKDKDSQLKIVGNPGQTAREVWTQYSSRVNSEGVIPKPSRLYQKIINYVKNKFSPKEELDPRDEIIKG